MRIEVSKIVLDVVRDGVTMCVRRGCDVVVGYYLSFCVRGGCRNGGLKC